MPKQVRRRFPPEYKEQAVAGATHSGVAAELGVTPTQLKTWRPELEAAGSASAIERQRIEAAELAQLMCRVLGVARSWFHAWHRAAPLRAERAA